MNDDPNLYNKNVQFARSNAFSASREMIVVSKLLMVEQSIILISLCVLVTCLVRIYNEMDGSVGSLPGFKSRLMLAEFMFGGNLSFFLILDIIL